MVTGSQIDHLSRRHLPPGSFLLRLRYLRVEVRGQNEKLARLSEVAVEAEVAVDVVRQHLWHFDRASVSKARQKNQKFESAY